MRAIILAMSFVITIVFSQLVLAEDAGENTISIVHSNSSFALDLYGKLKNEQSNLFFSPWSISTVLAMTYAGARGDTGKEMSQVLQFNLDAEEIPPTFAKLIGELNGVRNKGNIQLSIANALWTDKNLKLLSSFVELARNNYHAEINYADFGGEPERARSQINNWVESQTNSKIKDLIKPGMLDSMTSLLLINAIYFKGNWTIRFEESNTRESDFWIDPGASVKVPMMTRLDHYKYMESDSIQMLEFSYKGNDLSMVVILPKSKNGLSTVEASFNMENLSSWLSGLKMHKVEVFLPKFKITGEFDLDDTLSSLGMPDAFNRKTADFSGIGGTKNLFISSAIHNAYVEVNEEGTEAAGASSTELQTLSMPIVFQADHPFIFLIRENRTGSILFIGRILNPKE